MLYKEKLGMMRKTTIFSGAVRDQVPGNRVLPGLHAGVLERGVRHTSGPWFRLHELPQRQSRNLQLQPGTRLHIHPGEVQDHHLQSRRKVVRWRQLLRLFGLPQVIQGDLIALHTTGRNVRYEDA